MNVSLHSLVNLLLTSLLGLTSGLIQAQPVDRYVQADSVQAYWRLRADYASHKPVIEFFNRHHQLIYQEELPESARLMTKRTTHAFDVLLANLTSNRVLVTAYLTNPDLLLSVSPSINPTPELNLREFFVKKGAVIADFQPTLSPVGKLTLHFVQAKHRLIGVTLEDEEQGTSYFDDYSNLILYHRDLNLSQLPGGIYRLKIRGYFSTFVYRLSVDRAMNRYALQKIPRTD